MVLCAGSILVIYVEQNDFLGDRRVMGQSSAEACSQVSCSLGDWPNDVIQKLNGINQHHVWSITVVTETLRDLTSTALSPFLKQPYSSIRAGGTGLSLKWKTSAISTLRCFPTTNSRLNSVTTSYMAFPLTVTAFLSNSIVLTFFFIVLWNSLLSEAENCLLRSLPMANAF